MKALTLKQPNLAEKVASKFMQIKGGGRAGKMKKMKLDTDGKSC